MIHKLRCLLTPRMGHYGSLLMDFESHPLSYSQLESHCLFIIGTFERCRGRIKTFSFSFNLTGSHSLELSRKDTRSSQGEKQCHPANAVSESKRSAVTCL